jgi:hypothetical protein
MYEKADPDGDLLITLEPSTEPFAPWPTERAEKTYSKKTPEKTTGKRPREPEPKDCLQVVVSSKVMTLVSARFKKMLTGPWKEATTVYPDGLRHVDMEGFDKEAFMILLHIFHSNTSKVPRTMDVDQLAKIAVLVDDLQCHEAVVLWVEIWIKHCYESDEDDGSCCGPYCCHVYDDRDLLLWILISSVFNQPDIFRHVTRVAILHSHGPIPTLGLSVRDKKVESGWFDGMGAGSLTVLY